MDAAGFAWLPWILVDGAVVGNLGRLWARTLVAVSKPEARLIKVGSLNAVPPGSKTSVVPYCATIFWKSVSAHFFPCLRFSDLINGIFGRAGPTPYTYENNSTHTNQHRFNAATASPEQRQRKRSDATQRSYYRGITGADAGGKPHLRAADQVLSRSYRCARPERDRWRSEFHH